MTRRKMIARILRVVAAVMFLAIPASVIYTKYPAWREQGGGGIAIGSGTIILIFIAFITFKKYITAFAAERMGTMSAGLSLCLLWSGLTLVCAMLASITSILDDLTTVFLWSAIGAVCGLICQGAARRVEKREEKPEKETISDAETD